MIYEYKYLKPAIICFFLVMPAHPIDTPTSVIRGAMMAITSATSGGVTWSQQKNYSYSQNRRSYLLRLLMSCLNSAICSSIAFNSSEDIKTSPPEEIFASLGVGISVASLTECVITWSRPFIELPANDEQVIMNPGGD